MGRSYTEIPLDGFRKEFNIADKRVTLYVDDLNSEEIFEVLATYIKHFNVVLFWLLKGVNTYNDDHYGDESISAETKGIKAMKFKTGKGQNYRIYCREFFNSDKTKKKVIMSYAFHKKSEGMDKKLINLLKAIGEYDYEITW